MDSGLITNTCVNTGVSAPGSSTLPDFRFGGSGRGDSGSDVFQITGSSNVMLAGSRGGNRAGPSSCSARSATYQELGALTTH